MERKKIRRVGRLLVVSGILILFAAGSANAAGGKDLFLNKCGSCHGSGKTAKAVNPGNYAGSQWKNFFKRNKHQRKKDISNIVSQADATKILSYLVKNAADSDKPEVAAIP